MTERYWEAGEPPKVLLDWVNENVCQAIKDSWTIDTPIGWIDVNKKTMLVTFAGPERPDDRGDIFTLKLDLLYLLTNFATPYANIGGPRSEAQREDMRERAAMLRELAEAVSNMAAEADKCG